MRSKISFFNKTIFWKNITHFWPIWVIYSMVCFWCMLGYFFLNTRNYNDASMTSTEQTYLKIVRALDGIEFSINPWIVFAFSIVSAIAVFSYLYTSRTANMMHALPVRREELFVTNYLSGILFMLVPQVLTFLLAIFVWFANGMNQLEYLLQWLGIVTGETFFAYSLGVFCVMLAGNRIAAVMYFAVINYFYHGFWSVWNMVRKTLLYGFMQNTEMTYGAGLVPMEYFRKNVRIVHSEGNQVELPTIEGLGCLKWHAMAALVLAILALAIYRKRQLECASDMIAISWIKPVARWVGAVLCAGLIGELIQSTFVSGKALLGEAFPVLLLCWNLGGLLSFFGIEMMIEKRFMVFHKRILAECGMFLVLVTAFLGCMEMDVFQLEKKLPDVEKIEKVYVQGSYGRYITEPEEIKENIALHKKIVESKEEYQQYFKKYYGKKECNYMTVDMIYVMKNGKKQRWSYNLPVEKYYLNEEGSAVKELMRQESDMEDYMAYYFTEQYSNIRLQDGSSMDRVNEDYNFESVDISKEKADKLVKAFQKDLASGNYRIYPYGTKERVENTFVNTLTICYLPPKGAQILFYMEDDRENISEGIYPEYSGIILTKDCKNTIAMLEEMGIIDKEHRLVTEKEYNAVFEENINID